MVSPLASASSTEDPYHDLVQATILLIPLRGILLLGAISLLTALDKERACETPSFHMANILAVVALISFMESLYWPFVLLDLQSTTLSFAVLAVVSVLLHTLVFSRYLLFPFWLSGLVGALLAGLSVVWWNHLLGLTAAQVDDVVGSLQLYFLAFMFVFVCLLALETLRHHHRPGGGPETPPSDPQAPSVRDRTQRIGEMLLAITVLAIASAYIWS
jgi:hypothetical protein